MNGRKNGFLSKIYLALIMFFLYAPIGVMIFFSFNNGRTIVWKGFSLKWYEALFNDNRLMGALVNTLLIAVLASLFATILGTAAAIGISNFKGKKRVNLITRVKSHAEKHGLNTEYLSGSIDDISAKVDFFKNKTKGSKNKLSKSPVAKSTKDILVLKDNSTYIKGVNFDKESYIFDVAVFSDALNFGKIIRQVYSAEKVIRTTFFGLPVKINITVYSHYPENKGLVAKTRNYLKSKNYENEVNFKFFDTKRKLFSGIDINKWL